MKAKIGGFKTFDDWIQAQNEGFDTKLDWDDWNEIKKSGFSDLDLFNETKNIRFYQNDLRKAFLSSLKLAKKGGFISFQAWKDAQKWKIDSYAEWLLVRELNLQSLEEFHLVKQFEAKLGSLLNELFPNQELPLLRLIEIFAEDYKYDHSKTGSKDIVYSSVTKQRFEELLEKTIKFIILDRDNYKYSRLTNSIFKIFPVQSVSISTPQTQKNSDQFQCPNCHNKISKTNSFCQFCGQKIEKCPICQLPLITDSPSSCPQCNSKFHLNHLQEVIKVTGKCPVCKTNLQEHQIL